MPAAWRIIPARRVGDAFTGEGAKRYGGRWNSSGTALVYASGHKSLAALELLVHVTPTAPMKYKAFFLEWEERMTERFAARNLPEDWRAEPPTTATMRIGDEWARAGRSVVLAVPSAIIPEEMNFLLNPVHPDFKKLRISAPGDFVFDSRLLA